MDPVELTVTGSFVLAAFATIFTMVTKHKSNKSSIPPASMRHTDSQIEEIKDTLKSMDNRLRRVELNGMRIATHLKIPHSDTY
jgi:hypothetical protein